MNSLLNSIRINWKYPIQLKNFFYSMTVLFKKWGKLKKTVFTKNAFANGNLFDAFLAANGSDLVKKDETLSVIFCKWFYDKTKIVENDDNSSIENQPEIQKNFGVQITKNEDMEVIYIIIGN